MLTTWVKIGAPWPESYAKLVQLRTKITDEDRAFWAFQPVGEINVPSIESAWCRNPIDRFVLRRLQKEGLAPAAPADRIALIRRVYFDLIGLPPNPQEVEQFLNDKSPNAYERLVDELLKSPQYGERWARHWLDLVRYAESDGYKQDAYRPDAWRYRDYVVRSFNNDKPYDKFVMEQLAGDEIAPGDPEAIVATGYLRHWIYEYNQRDVRTQWDGILNDVTDVTGDVFLGMGMGCARCHDHKFDPILQKDYYRLRAFFAPMLPREDLERQPIVGFEPDARIQTFDGLHVVRKDVWARLQNRSECFGGTLKVRRQQFDLHQGIALPDRSYGLCEYRRPTVRQIIAIHRCDHSMLEP